MKPTQKAPKKKIAPLWTEKPSWLAKSKRKPKRKPTPPIAPPTPTIDQRPPMDARIFQCVMHVVAAIPKFSVDQIVQALKGDPFTVFQVRIESEPNAPHRYRAFYRSEKGKWHPEVTLRKWVPRTP